MKIIDARNVHEALPKGVSMVIQDGYDRESRAGNVKVIDGPVTTVYRNPTERVMFHPDRDCNPFFHFMEGLWMIAGRNDVQWISQFSSNIGQFSDDGETFHGAYGYRWLNHFSKEQVTNLNMKDFPHASESYYVPFNQLECVAGMLRENPDERRCVVSMWSAEDDLGRVGKDVPCNTTIMFSISVIGELDMTVTNRSNDMVWGAYGANAVHFSMLQEFMASWIGVPVGRYWQVSNNFHSYVKTLEPVRELALIAERKPLPFDNPYEKIKGQEAVAPFPMVNSSIDHWIKELQLFMEAGPVMGIEDRFFRKVAAPIWDTWFAWKGVDGESKRVRIENALNRANGIAATDWRKACIEWLERRA